MCVGGSTQAHFCLCHSVWMCERVCVSACVEKAFSSERYESKITDTEIEIEGESQ